VRGSESLLTSVRLWRLLIIVDKCEALKVIDHCWHVWGSEGYWSLLTRVRLWRLLIIVDKCEALKVIDHCWQVWGSEGYWSLLTCVRLWIELEVWSNFFKCLFFCLSFAPLMRGFTNLLCLVWIRVMNWREIQKGQACGILEKYEKFIQNFGPKFCRKRIDREI
jgi:hypothetical protein